jgi:PAS domain S-box-containing protein
MEDVFGIARGSFGGTAEAFRSLVHPEDLPRLRDEVARSLRTGEEYCVIFRYRHASGEWRWMEGRGLPLLDATGKPVRLDGVGIDVTERTLADHARSRLAAIVESSDDAILSKTLDGTVTSWNAGAARLFGYSAEEMIGQSILKLIPPELHAEEEQILAKVRNGERVDHYETRRLAKDGSILEVSLSVSPLRDANGVVIGASKIARDIGGLRRAVEERERLLASERSARAEAERLSHIKDEFLSTLSHELRTPLTAIVGWVTLLRRHASLPPAQVSAALETIYRNARAQARIIEDLLDMSRIVAGKIRLQPEALDLGDLIHAATDGIRPAADAKRIAVELLPMKDPVMVTGDAARLQQVLWNVLTNAVKFTPAGGRITVGMRLEGEQAEVRIQDTGIGIKPEFLPRVFERFRQGDGSTTREHGGLGLGLSIVRNLVELHGGSITAHSAGEGLGATFILRLPALLMDRSAHAGDITASRRRPAAVEPVVSLHGATVLVVDDDPDSRALLSRLLGDAGARVLEAKSAAGGIGMLQADRVDVILSDIGMPEMDGFEFIRQVRSDSAGRHAPAIAVTAFARPEDRERCLAAGYQRYFAKPYSFTELASAINSLRGSAVAAAAVG